MSRKSVLASLLCFIFFLACVGCRHNESKATEVVKSTEVVEIEDTQSLEEVQKEASILMIGDVLMHTTVMEAGKKDDGSYDYSMLFSEIENDVKKADIAILNQETILGGTEYGLSSYPCFNSPQEVGDAEVDAGFDVASAKELADFVMVSPHWGIEYHHEIDGSQVDWTNLFLECGVDLVIGTHPHCIQPIEVLEREDGHKMLVYYSLGNYVNGTNEDGTVGISYYTVVPLICHFGVKEEYKVYKLEDYTDELAQANLIKLQAPSFSRQACVDIIKQVWPATE